MASGSARDSVLRLMNIMKTVSCRCPAHSQTYGIGPRPLSKCHSSTDSETYDYAFEMSSSIIRYGAGVTQEVGMDLKNYGSKNVCLVTDETISKLPPFTDTVTSLEKNGIKFSVYDKTRVEPTDVSFKAAIDFARERDFDAFLSVGGGSVMDTAKVANLYTTCHENDFLDFVNAPIGKGLVTDKVLKPHIAIPTTAGTGSETTGISVFDFEENKAKTGIAVRAMRPTLGILDPLHTRYMPARVAANSGFDVLCHALEAYTAIPHNMRSPRPTNPNLRPVYQGSNPISDVWTKHALMILAKNIRRAVKDCDDMEARSNMHLASSFAGIGFGNAGVHLCHGMSYTISGMVRDYKAQEYQVQHPLIPHGLSVVMSAPAVFDFTAPACPERHLEAAGILGADITNKKAEDGGKVLSDTLRGYMYDLGVDNGLTALGYTTDDIPNLVKGTLPQKRVTKLAPAGEPGEEELALLFEKSMVVF